MLWPKLILAASLSGLNASDNAPTLAVVPLATTSGPQSLDPNLGTRGSCAVRLHSYFGAKRP